MNQIYDVISQNTSGRGLYDITPQLKKWLNDQVLTNGLLTLNIQHTSASLLINENYDSDVLIDLENFFARLVKDGDENFIHTTEGDDDMPAHIRTALTQTNLSIPIKNKVMMLGTCKVYLYTNIATMTLIEKLLYILLVSDYLSVVQLRGLNGLLFFRNS